jgi:hypothetical protein
MLRSFLSAVALAGLLATGQPAFAETASDHVQPGAAATEQPVLAPLSSSSNMTAPVSAEHGKAPVGFGWG